MKILVLNGHPDAGSFTDALADAYVKGALAGGHQGESTNIRDLKFDLILRGGYKGEQLFEPDLVRQQELIRWCQHLVLVTPCWWWSMPALLKGYVDRVFLPGFAMRYHDEFPYVEPLLTGRSARLIYTQNAPQLLAWAARGDLFWKVMKKAVLEHCGFDPVRRTVCGPVVKSSESEREEWLEKVFRQGRAGQ